MVAPDPDAVPKPSMAAPAELPGDWIAERKLDGVRALARDGRLYTRRGTDVTEKFPEITVPEADVDGELVPVQGALEDVVARVQRTGRFDIEMGAKLAPVVYKAFDVVTFDGAELADRPLAERAGHLHAATKDAPGVVVVEPHDDPAALWDRALARGWEGVVAKDPTAPYPAGRTESWLKVKTWEEGEFPILDHERTDADGFVVYVDAGADEPQKVNVGGEADQRAVAQGADVAEVQYLERSKHGRLRNPSLKRVA